MSPSNETGGGGKRRSGRRSSAPLQHIQVGGSAPVEEDDLDLEADEPDLGEAGAAPSSHDAGGSSSGTRRGGAATGGSARRPVARPVRTGLDRIKSRVAPVASDVAESGSKSASAPGDARNDLSDAAGRDPLGRAALYSSGDQQAQPALGTFMIECSACRRETPVVAGDLVRLGIPSFHLPFVKRFPSLMRCPACGRRTWVRVRWRL